MREPRAQLQNQRTYDPARTQVHRMPAAVAGEPRVSDQDPLATDAADRDPSALQLDAAQPAIGTGR